VRDGYDLYLGHEISVGDVGFAGAPPWFCSAIDVACYFDVLFFFAFDAFGVVIATEFLGTIIAIFLQVLDLAGEPTEGGDHFGISIRIGGEKMLGFWFEEELRELSGGELKADLGNLAGVIFAEVIGEVVLMKANLNGVVLLGAPFFVTAAGFPVGDVAFGHSNAVFVEGTHDFSIRDIVTEHEIDHVSF
jgi:hypothetical protein